MTDGDTISTPGESIPEKMRALPVYAGLPVPWFAYWRNHHPDFRAPISPEKLERAVTRHVCIICGRRLRRPAAFFGEVAMGITCVSAAPPAHRACGAWALGHSLVLCGPAHFGRVKMLWLTRAWEVIDGTFRLGAPEAVEFYFKDHSAPRAAVAVALGAAFAEFEERACDWPGGIKDLRRRRNRFEWWLPGK